MINHSGISDILLGDYSVTNVNAYYESLGNMVRITVGTPAIGTGLDYTIQILNSEKYKTPIMFINVKENYVPQFIDDIAYVLTVMEHYRDSMIAMEILTPTVDYMIKVTNIAIESIQELGLILLKVGLKDEVLIGTFRSWDDCTTYFKEEIKYSIKQKFEELTDQVRRKHMVRLYNFNQIH